MRIRLPFAGVFAFLLLLAGYAGLSSLDLSSSALPVNDKALHLATFFALTVAFYWVVDTTRRRTLHLTLAVCTLGLGAGSEVLQALLPNGRSFDPLDVVANLAGSLAALALCAWYHKRMLERRRLRKYTAVPSGAAADEDVELGEGPGLGRLGDHEEGVTGVGEPSSNPVGGGGGGQRTSTLEEEVDNWDENAVDPWDEEDAGDASVPPTGKGAEVAHGEHVTSKKRSD